MKIPASSALLALVFAIVVPAQAALTWETTEVDLHPGLADKTAVAHFKYKNTGDKPVKITSVHPSCGCTTAALAKEVVGPNESGEITATFNIGDRSGVQTKSITVRTDDQTNETTKHGWSVVLLGRGRLLDRPEVEALARDNGLESWAGGDKSLYVRLGWRHISGREVGWNEGSDPADALLRLRASTGP